MTQLSAATTISRQEASVSDQGQFLRLSDKKPGEKSDTDRLTVGEAADTLAGIFGKGTCGSADQDDAYQLASSQATSLNQSGADYLNAKYTGAAEVAELAEKFGVADLCPATLAPTGQKTLPVYCHGSSDAVFEDYRLISYGCPMSGPKIIEEEVQLRFEFSRSASLPIYYYVDYVKLYRYQGNAMLHGDMFEWRGNPKNNRGERVDPPSVRIQDGQVLLHGYYSGILIVRRLPIKYHKYLITLNGTAMADGQREYKGRVSAISTAHNLGPVDQQVGEAEKIKDAAAECPLDDGNPLATGESGGVIVCRKNPKTGEMVCDDEDSGGPPKGKDIFCFIEAKKELRQNCTDDYLRDLPTEYRSVDCPDNVTPTWNSPASLNYNPALPEYYHRVKTITEPVYTSEGAERQITDEEYEDVCCHAPEKPGCVPFCREKKSTFYGPVEIEGGRQKYIDAYSGKTVFIPVGTEAGPCGTLTDTFIDADLDCCGELFLHIGLLNDQLVIKQGGVTVYDTADYYGPGIPSVDLDIDIQLDPKKTVYITVFNNFPIYGEFECSLDYYTNSDAVQSTPMTAGKTDYIGVFFTKSFEAFC